MNSDHSPKNKHAISKTRSTSVDVAKLAGVSQATVSRAFDPTSKMRPQTRAKVLTAAKQLKYTPDAIAKSLISNTTNIIAIIMQDVVNPYYSQLLKDFSIHLQHYGKQLLYFYLDSPDNLQNLIYQVLQYRVEGIIISSITLTKQLIGALPDNLFRLFCSTATQIFLKFTLYAATMSWPVKHAPIISFRRVIVLLHLSVVRTMP